MQSHLGKTILIFGGNSGIGAAAAHKFASAGWRVVIAARRLEELKQVAGHSPNITYQTCDISCEAEVTAVFNSVTDREIAAVLNTASMFEFDIPLEDTTLTSWEKLMSVNATGSFLIGREAVRHLKKNGVGVFVTVSSLAGLYHRVLGQRVSYSASKAVQTAVMATADAEFTEQSGRKGPRAFVVCPGLVKDTPMVQNWLKEHPEAADQGITAEAAAEALYGLISKSQDWDYFAYELGADGLTRAEPAYT